MTNGPTSPETEGAVTERKDVERRDQPSGAETWIQRLQTRLGLGGKRSMRDMLETMISEESDAESAISAEERRMLLALLRFGAARVEDIMVPRADIIALDEDQSLAKAVLTFEEAGVSRLPIYHDTLDDPRGMIHIKDLFRWISAEVAGRPIIEPRTQGGGARTEPRPKAPEPSDAQPHPPRPDLSRLDLSRPISVAKILRQVLFVPPSMPAMNLLIRMQATRIHMALVVDEYGGTDGLVTIEDLVEQIVGDIEDEHDEQQADHIVEDARLGLVASGRAPVKELEARLGQKLLTEDEEAEIDTLGGLVFAIVGRVPARGELVSHPSGLEFEVLEADPRRIKKLRIHLPAKSAAGAEAPSERG